MTPEQIEETVCSCGAGHGSLEGHTDWCAWFKVERFAYLAQAAREFAKSSGLASIRVQGKMMTRKQVIEEL